MITAEQLLLILLEIQKVSSVNEYHVDLRFMTLAETYEIKHPDLQKRLKIAQELHNKGHLKKVSPKVKEILSTI